MGINYKHHQQQQAEKISHKQVNRQSYCQPRLQNYVGDAGSIALRFHTLNMFFETRTFLPDESRRILHPERSEEGGSRRMVD